MAQDTLDSPVTCCGRTFTLRRALDAHERSHQPCGQCTFSGCAAALKLHAWSAHGIGDAPPPTMTTTSTRPPSLATGRTGATFAVVDETRASPPSLEDRFPGAEIVWTSAEAAAIDPEETDGVNPPASVTAEVARLHAQLVAEDRIVLVVGATGSGKSRLIASLAAASEPSLEPGREADAAAAAAMAVGSWQFGKSPWSGRSLGRA